MKLTDLIPSFIKDWTRIELEDTSLNDSESFIGPNKADGATEIEVDEYTDAGGAYNQIHSFLPQFRNTKELITQYRTIAQFHEVDDAIQEIISDAIVYEDYKDPVSINLDRTDISSGLKVKIEEEFQEVLKLYDFRDKGMDIFRRWYVDSRIYFHKILYDGKKGIKELRRLDPRNMEFIREIKKSKKNGIDVITGYEEYFVYTPTVLDYRYSSYFTPSSTQQIKIPKDAIIYAHSGLTDVDAKTVIGYLHRAIKPANQLKMLEDALVIYRLARAPERRAIYIDVGNMQNKKAAQYVNGIMNRMKNRVVYDSSSGKVKSQSNQLSMLEDFYLMRRDGKSATEIETLQGGQNLGEMDDILYFKKNLYSALKVPLSRLPSEDGGTPWGPNNEITRDELNFTKWVRRLQNQFKKIFQDALLTNLIIKGIVTRKEWDSFYQDIDYVFNKDSHFEEMQEIEAFNRRVESYNSADTIIGKYISNNTAMKRIFRMSDEDIENELKKISEERAENNFTDEEL